MKQVGSTAQTEVEKVMRAFNAGTLRSSTGHKVTSHEQAIAIGLSKARAKGAKVPRPEP